VLEGVARRIVLEVAAAADVPVRLEAARRQDLAAATEAALSSASRAIVPVVQVQDQIIGGGRPGPVVGRLLAAYQAYVAAHLQTAVAAGEDARS
jgi:D-alanine transaminase